MIKKESFDILHIKELSEGKRCDPILLERSIYAFGLLESLLRVNMPFIFKGGTSLMVLLEHPRRLSTDVDIIMEPGTDIDGYLELASEIFPFKRQEEQIRVGKNNVVKRHFKFYYDSPVENREFYILLDVLFEGNHYRSFVEKEIKNDLLITEEPYFKSIVPSVNCILGDKMTAFAPHTTGIPFGADKEMEIIKQLFDVISLAEVCDNFQDVYDSYMGTVESEIAYRGNQCSAEECLRDTIETAACIVSRGSTNQEEYRLLSKGIKSVRSHIYGEKFSGELAACGACLIMYLAACILKNEPFQRITEPERYIDSPMAKSKYSKLSYIKKLKLESYGYLFEAVRLLGE
ncbi:MAG: nucleotidyl transferase AbiEii/AbiGii toxin family protein [Lachnospiraceae bacterium]|nr:nucleotidyl transferase AbiEii/AbiGii toxin family protein [Lachnospiraceae bacterium]